MNNLASVPEVESKNEVREQVKQQLAQYVAQQSPSMQTFHRWMKGLEVASLVIVAAGFILAMFVSINWTNLPAQAIPTAWFAFVGSFSLTMLLVGFHTVILRASPPVAGLLGSTRRAYSLIKTPARPAKFVTGREAVHQGWGVVVMGVVTAAFWGLFAYAAWTVNMAILTPMITFLTVLLGVGIAVSIVYSIIRSVFRSISRSH